MREANLSAADLRDASLVDVDLRGAGVQDADFGRANLRGANLQGVDLDHADIGLADLHAANLLDTKLTQTVDRILTEQEAWQANEGGQLARFQEAQLVGEYYNYNGVEKREEVAAQLGQRAQAAEEAGKQGGLAADHYYSEHLDGYPPPRPRWEAVKATVGEWVGRVTERFSGPSPEEMQAAPQPAPPILAEVQHRPTQAPPPAPQRAAVQEAPTPQNGPPPPGWSHEEIAQNKALAQEISQIRNPERRADAERLLAGIKAETEALQPRRQRGQGLELEP